MVAMVPVTFLQRWRLTALSVYTRRRAFTLRPRIRRILGTPPRSVVVMSWMRRSPSPLAMGLAVVPQPHLTTPTQGSGIDVDAVTGNDDLINLAVATAAIST